MKKKIVFIIVPLILISIGILTYLVYGQNTITKEKDRVKEEIREFTSKVYTEVSSYNDLLPEKIIHLDDTHVIYQFPLGNRKKEVINNELKITNCSSSTVLRKYTFQIETERTRKIDEHKQDLSVNYEKLVVNIYNLEGEKPKFKETIDIKKLIEENNIKSDPTKLIHTDAKIYQGQEAIIVETENNPTIIYFVDTQESILVEDYQNKDNEKYKKEMSDGKKVFHIFTETNFDEKDTDDRLIGFYFTNLDVLTYTLSSKKNKDIALFKKYPEILEYLKNDNLKTKLYVYNPDPNKIDDYLKDSVVEGKNPYSGMVLGERQSTDEKEHIITSSEEFKKWYKPFDFSKE